MQWSFNVGKCSQNLGWELSAVVDVRPTVTTNIEDVMRNVIDEADDTSLTISFSLDMRNANVRLRQHVMTAILYDLLTIVEVMKTTDRKNLYKVEDVSQIMVCSHTADSSSSKRMPKAKNNKAYPRPNELPLSMKNAKKKHFCKAIKEKYVDVPEIGRELEMLLHTTLQPNRCARRGYLRSSNLRRTAGKVRLKRMAMLQLAMD